MNSKKEFVWPKKPILILIIFMFLSPLGMLASGAAWGEWDVTEWHVPNNWVEKASSLAHIWMAPLPDYSIPNLNKGALPYLGYIVSAIIGVILLVAITYLISYLMVMKK